MKKVYIKPEAEIISIVSQENIADDTSGEVVDGSLGLEDAGDIEWN